MAETKELDLTGLKCPMPIVELNKLIKQLGNGDEIVAVASDPAFCLDVEAWCNETGHELLHLTTNEQRLTATIRKRS